MSTAAVPRPEGHDEVHVGEGLGIEIQLEVVVGEGKDCGSYKLVEEVYTDVFAVYRILQILFYLFHFYYARYFYANII